MPSYPQSPVMGQMMSQPLLDLQHPAVRRAALRRQRDRVAPRRTGHAELHRYTYRDCEAARAPPGQALRARRAMGERVGTLAWNGYRHLELYYAVSGSGAVLHTINPRLHPEQIAYIVNHAEDQCCSST
jgi:acyl-CoA synthetase (AMP-forming)/AMP-acid ligase II